MPVLQLDLLSLFIVDNETVKLRGNGWLENKRENNSIVLLACIRGKKIFWCVFVCDYNKKIQEI